VKVIIAGSRHMPSESYPLIGRAVVRSGFPVTEVVCGMAAGADALGHRWADAKELPVKEFPADWSRYGQAAGPIRNRQMAEYADALIVFIWGNSRGSENMRKQMEERRKPVFVIRDGVIP
jgi:hypothetical protein